MFVSKSSQTAQRRHTHQAEGCSARDGPQELPSCCGHVLDPCGRSPGQSLAIRRVRLDANRHTIRKNEKALQHRGAADPDPVRSAVLRSESSAFRRGQCGGPATSDATSVPESLCCGQSPAAGADWVARIGVNSPCNDSISDLEAAYVHHVTIGMVADGRPDATDQPRTHSGPRSGCVGRALRRAGIHV